MMQGATAPVDEGSDWIGNKWQCIDVLVSGRSWGEWNACVVALGCSCRDLRWRRGLLPGPYRSL